MDKIRLNKTDSVHSVNEENYLEVNLENSFKTVTFNNIRKAIDCYELYETERSQSNKYRLILTINPFCTNVLFNPLTEIVKYSTTANNKVKIERLLDSNRINGIDGDDTSKRVQYIANTTYSNEDYGYTYYPGYDIFDNHILRCKSFNVINDTKTSNKQRPIKFNTLYDTARDYNGNDINMAKRVNGAKNKPSTIKKHVYSYDSLMTFEDCVNYNLSEQDGWLGFSNTTKLATYNKKNELANWCRVLNDKGSCEFVQMYPDRSTYLFTPTYNQYMNRLEYNWDVLITYPYENDYSNEFVLFNEKINAIRLYSGSKQTGLSGENIIMFRALAKHNLKRGDFVRLLWQFDYYEDDTKKTEYVENSDLYRVANIGNLKNDYTDYYFYVDDRSLFDKIDKSIAGKTDDEGKLIKLENITFYMQKITNGSPSKYYFRKFKKLDYDGDILSKEQYNLGFATTVYNDGITQITFTDNLDFSDFKDNLGRPLCEFFITILKTNRGNRTWYKDGKDLLTNDEAQDIEVSHCFTKLTDGLVLHMESNDYYGKDKGKTQRDNYNIRFIGGNNHNWLSNGKLNINGELLNSKVGDVTAPIETVYVERLKEWHNWFGITKDQEWFYGDVVEFITSEYKEYVIADVNYRFNSYQRENPGAIANGGGSWEKTLVYHNIKADDYDFQEEFTYDVLTAKQEPRNEGYFYKPHYPIRMKEEGELEQGGHYTIRLRSVDVVQNEDVYLRIVTMQMTNINVGDVILLMDDKNGKTFEFNVVYTVSKTTFLINPANGWFGEDGFIAQSALLYKDEEGDAALTWVDIAEHLRRGKDMFLRRRNESIPSYAVLADRNVFLWRQLYNSGEKEQSQIPEYIFTNSAFYITPVINFYVKRQDPNGYFGLYIPEKQNPQDIVGETKTDKLDNYEYKDTETESTC